MVMGSRWIRQGHTQILRSRRPGMMVDGAKVCKGLNGRAVLGCRAGL
jgi:hypothetical protein